MNEKKKRNTLIRFVRRVSLLNNPLGRSWRELDDKKQKATYGFCMRFLFTNRDSISLFSLKTPEGSSVKTLLPISLKEKCGCEINGAKGKTSISKERDYQMISVECSRCDLNSKTQNLLGRNEKRERAEKNGDQ